MARLEHIKTHVLALFPMGTFFFSLEELVLVEKLWDTGTAGYVYYFPRHHSTKTFAWARFYLLCDVRQGVYVLHCRSIEMTFYVSSRRQNIRSEILTCCRLLQQYGFDSITTV